MKILLITANVGSVFEYAEELLKPWCDKVLEVVAQVKPQFLAIHCQEIGGKNFEQTMVHLETFIDYIMKSPLIAEQYQRACIMCDGAFQTQENFTALGNLYFLSQDLRHADVWNFREQAFESFKTTQIDLGDIEGSPYKIKEKFPPEYFPGDKWSRKGFCLTRWRFGRRKSSKNPNPGKIYHLANIHLFHDASNLIAMKASPSLYSKCRKHAMDFTLNRINELGKEYSELAVNKESQNSQNGCTPIIPCFIFGDFNFRLDTHQLIKKLTEDGEAGCRPFLLKTVTTELSTDEGDFENNGDLGALDHDDLSCDQNIDHFKDGSGCILKESNNGIHTDPNFAQDVAVQSREADSPCIRIGKKCFDCGPQHESMFASRPPNPWLNAYDSELKPFEDRIFEFPITFSPSYPYTENFALNPNSYAKTRCPAWCDRLLISAHPQRQRLIDQHSISGTNPPFVENIKNATYQVIGQDTHMGDHKPVYLCADLD